MSNNTKNTKGVVAVRVPHHLAEFMKVNPQLAEIIGKFICSFSASQQEGVPKEYRIPKKDILEVFSDPRPFYNYLSDGTEEQVDEILQHLCNEIDNLFTASDLSEEEVDTITEEMAKQVGKDKIFATEIDFNKDVKTAKELEDEDDMDDLKQDFSLN